MSKTEFFFDLYQETSEAIAGKFSRQSRLGFQMSAPEGESGDLDYTPRRGAQDVGTIHFGDRLVRQSTPAVWGEFLERFSVADALGWEVGPLHVYVTLASLPGGDWATSDFSHKLGDFATEDTVDWDRWRVLLDLRDEQGLSDGEQAEYDLIAEVVARMDAQEEAITRPSMEALMKRHERVLSSIRRLTEAVRAAADRP